MTDSQKLHAAARRYCINQWYRWQVLYSKLEPRSTSSYTKQELAIFPRYILLGEIQIEIERFDSEKLPTLSELRELLILAAQVATPSGSGKIHEIARQAEGKTRDEFTRFIKDFDASCAVEPLPYRRALFGDELKAIRQILRERWGATSHCYPLAEAKAAIAPTLFAFNSEEFDAAIPEEKLAEILRAHGITRIYEIREFGRENYLQDVELMEPYYNGAEVFIGSEKWDWLFYASHEASVTTGGWLTQTIQDEWPDWQKGKYNPSW